MYTMTVRVAKNVPLVELKESSPITCVQVVFVVTCATVNKENRKKGKLNDTKNYQSHSIGVYSLQ